MAPSNHVNEDRVLAQVEVHQRAPSDLDGGLLTAWARQECLSRLKCLRLPARAYGRKRRTEIALIPNAPSSSLRRSAPLDSLARTSNLVHHLVKPRGSIQGMSVVMMQMLPASSRGPERFAPSAPSEALLGHEHDPVEWKSTRQLAFYHIPESGGTSLFRAHVGSLELTNFKAAIIDEVKAKSDDLQPTLIEKNHNYAQGTLVVDLNGRDPSDRRAPLLDLLRTGSVAVFRDMPEVHALGETIRAQAAWQHEMSRRINA